MRIGVPGRHSAIDYILFDRFCPGPHILVTQGGKWGAFSGAVAFGAIFIKDRRNVFAERNVPGCAPFTAVVGLSTCDEDQSYRQTKCHGYAQGETSSTLHRNSLLLYVKSGLFMIRLAADYCAGASQI
ncbi:MAG: hypothetical protein L0Y75_03555 [Acidobacteria bacterium]|nr:hypothetical protein [Acidobacteriota bacterium]